MYMHGCEHIMYVCMHMCILLEEVSLLQYTVCICIGGVNYISLPILRQELMTSQ